MMPLHASNLCLVPANVAETIEDLYGCQCPIAPTLALVNVANRIAKAVLDQAMPRGKLTALTTMESPRETLATYTKGTQRCLAKNHHRSVLSPIVTEQQKQHCFLHIFGGNQSFMFMLFFSSVPKASKGTRNSWKSAWKARASARRHLLMVFLCLLLGPKRDLPRRAGPKDHPHQHAKEWEPTQHRHE